MQQIHSTPPEPLEPLSPLSDCVLMKLHSQPQSHGEAELYVSIQFSEKEIELPNQRRITFGLRRGELRLKISGGKIPLETRGLITPLQREITIEEQYQSGTGGEIGISKDPGLKLTGSQSMTDKVQYKLYSVHSKGTEKEPVWVFEELLQDCLRATLQQERLGKVAIENSPCKVVATFGVLHQTDICFPEIDELLPGGVFRALKRAKQRHICMEFFKRCILPKLQQSISRVEHQLP
jgi:hypothetical protein